MPVEATAKGATYLRRLSSSYVRWVAAQRSGPSWREVHSAGRALQARLWDAMLAAGGHQARVEVAVDLFDATTVHRRRPAKRVRPWTASFETAYHWTDHGTVFCDAGDALRVLLGVLSNYGGRLVVIPTTPDGRTMQPTTWTVSNQHADRAEGESGHRASRSGRASGITAR